MGNYSNVESWFTRCRLAWLEREAQRSGVISRGALIECFGISAAQASADLQSYIGLNRRALSYDTSAKTYRWNPKAKLVINPAPWADFPQ